MERLRLRQDRQVETELPLEALIPKAQVSETVARELGARAILTGEEARLAQFQNLTANVGRPKAPYFVR